VNYNPPFVTRVVKSRRQILGGWWELELECGHTISRRTTAGSKVLPGVLEMHRRSAGDEGISGVSGASTEMKRKSRCLSGMEKAAQRNFISAQAFCGVRLNRAIDMTGAVARVMVTLRKPGRSAAYDRGHFNGLGDARNRADIGNERGRL
jgi:hypothetical protein